MALRRRALLLLCTVCLALGVAACGKENDESIQGVGAPGEAFREGLAEKMNGLEYNIFITRQLNTKIPPDSAFYRGPDPGPGKTIYGMFVQVCNREKSHEPAKAVDVDKFVIKDSQGNEFRPKPLPADNPFAYKPRVLGPSECIPASGSVAQQNSASGALLVYEFPLTTLENRPLSLEIQGGQDLLRGTPDKLRFELDI